MYHRERGIAARLDRVIERRVMKAGKQAVGSAYKKVRGKAKAVTKSAEAKKIVHAGSALAAPPSHPLLLPDSPHLRRRPTNDPSPPQSRQTTFTPPPSPLLLPTYNRLPPALSTKPSRRDRLPPFIVRRSCTPSSLNDHLPRRRCSRSRASVHRGADGGALLASWCAGNSRGGRVGGSELGRDAGFKLGLVGSGLGGGWGC